MAGGSTFFESFDRILVEAEFMCSPRLMVQLKWAIEQGQNFSARYTDNITVRMMVREALYFLPEAIRIFEKEQPGVQVTPLFQYDNGIESFLKDESDILFALLTAYVI